MNEGRFVCQLFVDSLQVLEVDILWPRWASTAVQHYCDTGTPINPSGFATRGRRMTPTSSQLDAAVGQFGPRERVVKPPTKSGEFLVCELCDAGKLADGIAVSTVNKTGSAANAWGEKPHSEAQAWCDLVEADRPLGVSKLFKYSCVVCVRTAQVFSREYFPIAKPSQSVLAAVRESGSHEGMRALVALAKGEVLADGVDPRQRRELLLTLHFSVLVSEYAAAVGLAATAAAAAAEQLLSPLIADGEWSAFSGQPAATPPAAKTIAPATEPRTVSLSTPPQRGEAVDFVVESVQETRHNGPVRLFANGRKFVCFGRYARGVRSGQRIRAAVERHEPSGRFGPQTVLDPATLRVGEAHKRPAGGASVAVARPDMPVILSASPRTTTGAAPPAKSALRAESVVEVEDMADKLAAELGLAEGAKIPEVAQAACGMLEVDRTGSLAAQIAACYAKLFAK
ncbi:hypothetical protein EMIHUDRAFT_452731 [Emiliania huxleyi CCMP1516]|uniref:Uncharacterized protein n=2 Tax=Emiliania huxleyi TaxID=2903 RepID=A0A0D3IG83_EMIH1|nr:hypothetical protein EMIHUDRAFT_452731 [Emiliania huxleyi CCMP1516]EOD10268.1 hypothetical protein EMIHUDRAFT_452731 [Emiliania huxleyi CCMP1516]|eukprot:XP_005762697.1 hypothetical protein EMIHUDRAFT_452731 [Emiliania huxleyi CCMP1516]